LDAGVGDDRRARPPDLAAVRGLVQVGDIGAPGCGGRYESPTAGFERAPAARAPIEGNIRPKNVATRAPRCAALAGVRLATRDGEQHAPTARAQLTAQSEAVAPDAADRVRGHEQPRAHGAPSSIVTRSLRRPK